MRLQLQSLHDSLSAKILQAMWKKLCCLLNGILFSELVRDRYFSIGGARQFTVDMRALMLLFLPFTAQPMNYFKQLRDALRLLSLPASTLRSLRDVSSASPSEVKQNAAPAPHHQLVRQRSHADLRANQRPALTTMPRGIHARFASTNVAFSLPMQADPRHTSATVR